MFSNFGIFYLVARRPTLSYSGFDHVPIRRMLRDVERTDDDGRTTGRMDRGQMTKTGETTGRTERKQRRRRRRRRRRRDGHDGAYGQRTDDDDDDDGTDDRTDDGTDGWTEDDDAD